MLVNQDGIGKGDIDPLTRLSIRYGSDKFGAHQYTPAYHIILQRFRGRPINLLEIGVGGYASPQSGGGSLAMWAEYFPLARIVGLDVMAKTLAISPRVTIVEGSQIDDAVLDRLAGEFGPFDVVIDDGSHVPAHMLHTLRRLYPHVAAEGVYIVEDTQTCFKDQRQAAGTVFEFAHLLGLQMHRLEGYQALESDAEMAMFAEVTESVTVQRNFISFVKGNNRYPSNFHLDFTDETIAGVYRIIENEAALNPASRNVVCRIDMNIWAGRHEAADRLAEAAMLAEPENLALLYELLRLMEWAGCQPRCEALQARIDQLAG